MTANKPTRESADEKSRFHGGIRHHESYGEAVTSMREFRQRYDDCAMYQDGECFVVYGWFQYTEVSRG